ncbi:phosphorylase superfamily protein [Verticillium dahliae]
MHRLVHVASRVWLMRKDDASTQRLITLAHLEVNFSTDEWEERGKWRQLLPHVLRVIGVNQKQDDWIEEEVHLRYWAGRCLLFEGRSREAVKLLEQVVAVRETTLAQTHRSRLASQHELVSAYLADRRVKEAIVLLERVVAVGETAHDETHPDRLAWLRNPAPEH